jgi:hypothetical protein
LPYRACKEHIDTEKQVSDWIYNSGRVDQGNLILGLLIGETEKEKPNE